MDGLVILDAIRGQLDSLDARRVFMDVLSLRHRIYSHDQPRFLAVDPIDLIATHFVLYRDGRPIGTIRQVDSARCTVFGLEFPLSVQVQVCGTPQQQQAYRQFREHCPRFGQLGLLCVDPGERLSQQRSHASQTAEQLIWSSTYWTQEHSGGAICFATHQKFRVVRWVKDMGLWPELGSIEHPLNRTGHDLILIRKIRRSYIDDRAALYHREWMGATQLDGLQHPSFQPQMGQAQSTG